MRQTSKTDYMNYYSAIIAVSSTNILHILIIILRSLKVES